MKKMGNKLTNKSDQALVQNSFASTLPRYVYIPKGRRNLLSLIFKMNSREKLDFKKFLHFNGTPVQPMMCTANNKWIFAKYHGK